MLLTLSLACAFLSCIQAFAPQPNLPLTRTPTRRTGGSPCMLFKRTDPRKQANDAVNDREKDLIDRLTSGKTANGQSTQAPKPTGLNAIKQGIAKIGTGEYDADTVNRQIESYIKQNKVMMFSWSNCPFCRKARAQLEALLKPEEYFILELDQMDQGKAFRYELSQRTSRTSVPQIWIGGEYVGGCNDGPGLLALQSQNKLVPMLQKAGCRPKTA